MIVLCILDGWGVRAESSYNAIRATETPHWDALCSSGSYALLQASEHYVGLPDKQIGNSEVGHASIGCGRVLLQDLPRIDASINDGSFAEHAILHETVSALRKSGGTAHIIGLLSDGGVHSHANHIAALAGFFSAHDIPSLLHAITDGRDTAQDVALSAIEAYEKSCAAVAIATVSGRFYAMDRDNNWERTRQAYDAIVCGRGHNFGSAAAVVSQCYADNVTDEFIPPAVIGSYDGMRDGDAFFLMNFRADRIRSLASMLVGAENCENSPPPRFVKRVGLTEYSQALNSHLQTLFPAESVSGSLGEVVSKADKRQLRIAETEKYAHVTYFFNGNNESVFPGEERILVPSPKVRRYDLCPQMAAYEVMERLGESILSRDYDLIVVNFANPDMVGHTGNWDAACEAVAVMDDILGQLRECIQAVEAVLLVTADHGNVEMMRDESSGKVHTAHTTNPVPFVLWGRDLPLRDGSLCDIAPTILRLMALPQPRRMSGRSLIADGA